ncbi:MAG: VWA domain-containing protein [Myxococcota bacterium]|nr:VWA domain-containing protein [Myxococcota bacterium]
MGNHPSTWMFALAFSTVIVLGGCGSSNESEQGLNSCETINDCVVGEACIGQDGGPKFCMPVTEPNMQMANRQGEGQTTPGRQATNGVSDANPSMGGMAESLPTIGSFAGASSADQMPSDMSDNGESNNTSEASASDSPMAGSQGTAPAIGVEEPTDDGRACPEIQRALKPNAASIPRVMLVVDRSWSMLQDEDRWTPIENALNQVTQALQEQVKFGLVVFPNPSPVGEPDEDMFGTCLASGRSRYDCEESYDACAPGEVVVNPDLNTSANIVQQLQDKRPSPNQGTPTASALAAAGAKLMENPTRKDLIIVATDGGPGCNFGLNPQQCVCMNASCSLFNSSEMCLDNAATVAQVEALAANGIKTIVLGISIGLPEEEACIADRCFEAGQACINGVCVNQAPQVLDAMAVAGQTDVMGRHFAVQDLDQIQQRLTAVAGSVAPCTYELNELEGFLDRLRVAIDDNEIFRDPNHMNGWDVVDGLLQLYGDACDTLRDGAPHTLSATCY